MAKNTQLLDCGPRAAMYLIGYDPDGPTKIGIAFNPIKRLQQMQVGHPKKLMLYAVYWVGDHYSAREVEQWLLKQKFQDRRVQGEWVDLGARELIPMLAELIVTKFGDEFLLEWEKYFVYVTPQELGYEHACAQLGFGS